MVYARATFDRAEAFAAALTRDLDTCAALERESMAILVRCLVSYRDIIKASPDMPAKMLACQRSVTKYSHADIIDEFYLARTVLTMLKLRDDPQGREMARYLEWLLLKTETRDRRRSSFRF